MVNHGQHKSATTEHTEHTEGRKEKEDIGKEDIGKEDIGKEDIEKEDIEKEDIEKEDIGRKTREDLLSFSFPCVPSIPWLKKSLRWSTPSPVVSVC